MKRSVLLIPVLALSLAACGREVVKESKETVVEKPTAARETVVVPPQVTKETIVQEPLPALRSCTYLSTTYSEGSLSCQNGYVFRCDDGTWLGRGDSC
jgi:hypothetical protein